MALRLGSSILTPMSENKAAADMAPRCGCGGASGNDQCKRHVYCSVGSACVPVQLTATALLPPSSKLQAADQKPFEHTNGN